MFYPAAGTEPSQQAEATRTAAVSLRELPIGISLRELPIGNGSSLFPCERFCERWL